MIESSIDTKGRTTLPKAVREALPVQPGNRVRYFIHQDGQVQINGGAPHSAAVRHTETRRPGSDPGGDGPCCWGRSRRRLHSLTCTSGRTERKSRWAAGKTHDGAERVYAAAQRWVDCCTAGRRLALHARQGYLVEAVASGAA